MWRQRSNTLTLCSPVIAGRYIECLEGAPNGVSDILVCVCSIGLFYLHPLAPVFPISGLSLSLSFFPLSLSLSLSLSVVLSISLLNSHSPSLSLSPSLSHFQSLSPSLSFSLSLSLSLSPPLSPSLFLSPSLSSLSLYLISLSLSLSLTFFLPLPLSLSLSFSSHILIFSVHVYFPFTAQKINKLNRYREESKKQQINVWTVCFRKPRVNFVSRVISKVQSCIQFSKSLKNILFKS